MEKATGVTLPPLVSSDTASLIVRLADRRRVRRRAGGRRGVFPARAAGVHVLLCRDRAVRLVRERWVCPVDLDFVVCP